jgi:hypothetical protein
MDITEPSLEFIEELTNELRIISTTFVDNNSEIRNRVIAQRKQEKKDLRDNKVIASTASYYLQEIENRILETIYKYCVDNGIIKNGVACLCFDGIMIEKQYYNSELLDVFNQLIINRFGLDLKFEQKEMNHYLDIIDDHFVEHQEANNLIDVDDVNSLEYKLLNLINTNHFKNQKFLHNIGRIIKSANCFKNPYAIWVNFM